MLAYRCPLGDRCIGTAVEDTRRISNPTGRVTRPLTRAKRTVGSARRPGHVELGPHRITMSAGTLTTPAIILRYTRCGVESDYALGVLCPNDSLATMLSVLPAEDHYEKMGGRRHDHPFLRRRGSG